MSPYRRFLFGCLWRSIKRRSLRSAYQDARELLFPGAMVRSVNKMLRKELSK